MMPYSSPPQSRTEIAIVGGGLAGGLIALALSQARPEIPITLFEAGENLGGNHRWSWFDSDIDAAQAGLQGGGTAAGNALLEPFRKTSWDGYDVRFPAYTRTLSTRYHSLASHDFHACLMRSLPAGSIRLNSSVTSMDAQGVTLGGGERISARIVLDCRPMQPSPHLSGGWQVFLGRHLRTPAPHKINRPVIMDARVRQHGAYRFVYALPLGADELFIEDTYYADSPVLDRSALSARIDRHCERHGIQGEILGGEAGVLPVITGGNFNAWQAGGHIDGVARAGAGGGFVHPLTSYTLPFAVSTALAIAREADLPGEHMAAMLKSRGKRHWKRTSFYRKLGRMLFEAGEPDQRHRIFEHFYQIPEARIERFYGARSSTVDKLRILAGRPPVPLGGAIAALASRGKPLIMDTEQK